jgi:purine-binding chemotaxis protein CheW
MRQEGIARVVMPLRRAAEFVLGACVFRGEAMPVVDLGRLLGTPRSEARRFVAVRGAKRTFVLAVDDVPGIEALPPASLAALPPLLSRVGEDTIRAVRAADGALLLVLETARMVPEEVFRGLERLA